MKEDSTSKATFAYDPLKSKEDSIPKANNPPKHGENLTMGAWSMGSSHSQLVAKGSGLESFSTQKLHQKVKLSHLDEHELLREETTKLY